MGDLKASYQEMASIASRMDSLAEKYNMCIMDIYNTIDELRNDWKGKDNVSFIMKANDYKEDLKALGDIIEKYATFLKESSSVVEQTQNDIASSASRL